MGGAPTQMGLQPAANMTALRLAAPFQGRANFPSPDILPAERSKGTVPEGGKRMDVSHANSLQTKHAGLERKIAEELTRPIPDGTLLMELKKRKLRIKEELAQIH